MKTSKTSITKVFFAVTAFFIIFLPVYAADKVVIGISPSMTATLNIIALQQGFFTKEGVNAELRIIESGSLAVKMMLNDELDISESSVFALVSNSFIRNDFKIYSHVSISGNDNMIIARKDKGIQKIADLKGKKIGVLEGAFPQYVLDLMLMNAGIDSKSITVVLAENDRLYQMLSSGEIDAVCFYGGWVDKAVALLKDNAAKFHDEKLVRVTVVHTGKTKTFERNPGLFSRVLRAYIKAEEYVKKNPDAALKAVAGYLKLDLINAQKIWKPEMIHVALEQSLINDMENIAQWQIDTGIQKSSKIPNYLNFIYYKSLYDVDRKRITIAY